MEKDKKVKAIAEELESVIDKLQSIGFNSCITRNDDGMIEVLMSKMPIGKYQYEKSVGNYHTYKKTVRYGKVVFEDYLTESEAKAELFGNKEM